MDTEIETQIAEALLEKLSHYVLETYGPQVYEEATSLATRAMLSLEGIAEDELDEAMKRIVATVED